MWLVEPLGNFVGQAAGAAVQVAVHDGRGCGVVVAQRKRGAGHLCLIAAGQSLDQCAGEGGLAAAKGAAQQQGRNAPTGDCLSQQAAKALGFRKIVEGYLGHGKISSLGSRV